MRHHCSRKFEETPVRRCESRPGRRLSFAVGVRLRETDCLRTESDKNLDPAPLAEGAWVLWNVGRHVRYVPLWKILPAASKDSTIHATLVPGLSGKVTSMPNSWSLVRTGGDTNYFIKNQGLEAQRNPTNNMLRELLRSIGIDVGSPHDCKSDGQVFLTNAILCLKTNGGLQGNVEKEWFSNCGRAFLRPLIEIVQPKVVVCLGERAWRSVTAAFDQPTGRFRDSVENPRGVQIMDGGCGHGGLPLRCQNLEYASK